MANPDFDSRAQTSRLIIEFTVKPQSLEIFGDFDHFDRNFKPGSKLTFDSPLPTGQA